MPRRLPSSPFPSLIAAACCLLPFAARAAPAEDPAAAKAALDTGAVHGEYLNGNFETVIARLESYRKEHPAHSREDSLFIARHLAVVYAADPRSSESGKYWMYRLAVLSPTADLAGMYASESIERAFAEVRAGTRAGSRAGRRRWLWIGAGGTALAAATALVLIAALQEDPERHWVPVDL